MPVDPDSTRTENGSALSFKFWLRPVRLQESDGLSRVEIGRLQGMAEENLETLLMSWEAFFGN
jgi:hypothetical protein